MADIVIVNPRFEVSFWGLETCMPLFGKRANMPIACLPLLAALVPRHHDVSIVDENIEALDFDRLARADMVCLTGMSLQGHRIRDILSELRARGVFTVVGGPMATVEPEELEDLADVIFIGEADLTWPQFIRDWEQGKHRSRYTQDEKTDLATLPRPRLELIKTQHYMFGSLQISRGCPFTCEFCDIIVTFGRKPRLKTSTQVLEELDGFLRAGVKIVFIVDDNLIGNKKAIKPILEDIIAWQEARGYPLTFFTEASLDLAEEDDLMALMGRAGFQSVFVGIESPNEASLKETKKLQNVRPRAGTLLDRVHRIQRHGLDVWCGMIVGFDHDDETVFEGIPRFLDEARLANALVGQLFAIPTTPLHKRLKAEGRLHSEEESGRLGTNVVPLLMKPQDMRQGFSNLMKGLYSAESYFRRVDDLFLTERFAYAVHRLPYWRNHRWAWSKRYIGNYLKAIVLWSRLSRSVDDPALLARYRQQVRRVLLTRAGEPHILFNYLIKIAMHFHYVSITTQLRSSDDEDAAMPGSVLSFSRSAAPRRAVASPRSKALSEVPPAQRVSAER